MQHTRRGWSFDAGHRAQVLIDRAKVVIGKVGERVSRHDLQEIAIEGRGNAVRCHGRRAGWMEMIQVHASCEFLYKLRVRSTAFRKSGFIRGQIAGDNIRRARNHGAKIPPAAQVCCGVDSRRLLAEVHRKRSIVSSAEAGSNAGNRTAGWPRRMADKEKPRPLACIIGAVPVGITPRAHPGVAATAGEATGMLACSPSNG
jgi:hypothetical protein